ncbi:hypothetical protein VME0621_01266 [Vibrio mediterranei]|nr:hypothetical protein VME0621_01266 [Vibrio mediterranei]
MWILSSVKITKKLKRGVNEIRELVYIGLLYNYTQEAFRMSLQVTGNTVVYWLIMQFSLTGIRV